MSTPKVMRLVDPHTGEMECPFCGARHVVNLRGGGYFYRGAWQCPNGCKPEQKKAPKAKE